MTEAYSYRSDPDIPAFPDDQPILFYDSVCVLCSGFVQFILRHDQQESIQFCAVQSPLGEAIYKHYDLSTDEYETNLFLLEGRAYTKSGSFLAVMSALGFPWNALTIGSLIPTFIRDPLYDLVARNRYRIFGKHTTCMLAADAHKHRFLS